MAKKKATTEKPQKKIVVDAMKVFSAESKAAANAIKVADGFDNFVSRLGLNNNNALSNGTYEFNLITRNRIKLEAAYRGSWVCGMVVDAVAEDMTRESIDIITNDEGGSDVKKIKSAISRLQINQSLCDNQKWGRLYGGSIGVIQIKGQKLDTPLNLDTVGKGQFQGIVVFDRWQVNPQLTDVIDSGPEMGLPSYYEIVDNPKGIDPKDPKDLRELTVAAKIHHSRVIRSIGIKLPYYQAITEMMWGESTLERLWDRLISFDNATMSSASLIDRANLRTVGVDGLREIIAAGGEAQAGLIQMFELMRELQVNEGLTLLDKNDTFASTAYSFAGLSDMMLQFGQQLSGASGIPLVRFFGQSPAGLSATGESDMRMYYDNIKAAQEATMRNPWEVLIKVMWRSELGKPAPDDLEFNFVPLWQMSATDKANNSKTTTETVVTAFEAGLAPKKVAMQELRDNASENGLFSNITDEDIQNAEEEEPPMPEAGAPAVPLPVPIEKPKGIATPPKKGSEQIGPPGEKNAKGEIGTTQTVTTMNSKPKLSDQEKIKRWLEANP